MSDLKELGQQLLNRLVELKNKKVFIFGDVGLDEYVQGDVVRISPEAPVPVVEVKSTDKKLGLSANVAANVKAFGGEVYLCALIGSDSNGENLKSLLKKQAISADHLITDSLRNTTSKLRVMSGHHHLVRVDFENKSQVSFETLKAHHKQIEEAIKASDVVIIQDYAKGLLTEESSQWIIQLSQKHGKKVVVDPYRTTPLSHYRGCQFMTPNRDEAFDLAKQIPRPEVWQNVDAIGPELMKATSAPQMVITLGADGMMIFDKTQKTHLPTVARQVFDVTGAGDTVIAAFALGLSANWDIKTSGLLANFAAGVVVSKVGAATCPIDELAQFLQQT